MIEPMNVAQKLDLFKLLVKVGFKEIEIGFPAASQPDFDFCRQAPKQDAQGVFGSGYRSLECRDGSGCGFFLYLGLVQVNFGDGSF